MKKKATLHTFKCIGLNAENEITWEYIQAKNQIEALKLSKSEYGFIAVFEVHYRVGVKYTRKLDTQLSALDKRVTLWREGVVDKRQRYLEEKKEKKKSKNVQKIMGLLGKNRVSSAGGQEIEAKVLRLFQLAEQLDLDDFEETIEKQKKVSRVEIPMAQRWERLSNVQNIKEGIGLDWDTTGEVEERVKKKKIGRVKEDEIILFTKRLALMLASGLTILKALDLLHSTASKNMKEVLLNITDEMRKGVPASKAFKGYPRIFDSAYLALLVIGESTGNMSGCLKDIVVYKERKKKLQSKIRSASVYPIILGGVITIVVMLGSVYFIPIFRGLFEQQGVELPYLTRVVFNAADHAPRNIGIMFLLVVFLCLGKKKIRWLDRGISRLLSHLSYKLPILRGIVSALNMYTFSATTSLMLSNGLKLTDTLQMVRGVLKNVHIKKEVSKLQEKVLQGVSMSGAMKELKYFDPLMYSIVQTGEETGQMSDVLLDISKYYDEIVNNRITVFTEMFQPLAILVVGLLAIPVILAVYLPILDISTGMGM